MNQQVDQSGKQQVTAAGRPEGSRSAGGREAVALAIVVTLLLHLVLIWISPDYLTEPERDPMPALPELEIVLEPIPDEPELDETYVRAAPNIEPRKPEDTRNISDRDQVAAQPDEALPDPENNPMVSGDIEESNRIVQGNPLQEPTPQAAPQGGATSGQSPLPQQEAAPRLPAEQPRELAEVEQPVPEDDLDAIEQPVESDDGVASVEVSGDAREEPEEEQPEEPMEETSPVAVTSQQDGRGQAQMTTPPQGAPSEDPVPRPRKRVERDTSFGPLKENREGALQIGRLSFDAEYSEFGEYWRRVAEIIEARWRNLVYNTRSIPFGGYRVVVEFSITRDGQVEDVRVALSDAGRLAETISKDAIEGEAPFFEWTPEMIVKMGDSAECAIHFYY